MMYSVGNRIMLQAPGSFSIKIGAGAKINKGPEKRLNGYKPPSGTRMKNGCIILLIQPFFIETYSTNNLYPDLRPVLIL